MKITLLYIGKDKKNFYGDPESLFVTRINHYVSLKVVGIDPGKYSNSISVEEIKKREESLILSKLESNPFILLDEKGSEYNSISFSKMIQKKMNAHSKLTFIVGGANGLSDEIKRKSAGIISLSQMTMPHHLARLVFLEQLYRAFTIIQNQPYHNI